MVVYPTPRLIIEHHCCSSYAADEEEVAQSLFGYVTVTPDVLMLQQVRMKIQTEWDWENDDDADAYQFVMDGKVRVSAKQESQLTVQEIIAQNMALSFRPKIRCNLKRAIATANNNNHKNMSKKKQKLDSSDEAQSFSSSSSTTTLLVDQTPPEATVTVTTEAAGSSESDDASMYCTTKTRTSTNSGSPQKDAPTTMLDDLKQPPLPPLLWTSSTISSKLSSPKGNSPSSCKDASKPTTSPSSNTDQDVHAAGSFDVQFSKKIETAKSKGNFLDLFDSSELTDCINPSHCKIQRKRCNPESLNSGRTSFPCVIKLV